MKYEELKELLGNISNIDDILKRFKVNVENNMIRLKQESEIDERNYGGIYSELSEEEQEKLYEEWYYISSECIFNLYNTMAWSTKEFTKKPIHYSVDDRYPYVRYYLSDAWDEIEKLDDWEFFYAMITLVKGINNKEQEIYRYIKYPIEEFLKEYKLIDLIIENVFVAMSFDEEMKDAKETIEKVIRKCGYNPIIMDEKQHNNEIVPELLFEIKHSKFIIADLTQQRQSVYYEVGYGRALNKDIILSCKSSEFSRVHFDLAQQNIINWKDKEDLEEKLEKRIEITVGKRS